MYCDREDRKEQLAKLLVLLTHSDCLFVTYDFPFSHPPQKQQTCLAESYGHKYTDIGHILLKWFKYKMRLAKYTQAKIRSYMQMWHNCWNYSNTKQIQNFTKWQLHGNVCMSCSSWTTICHLLKIAQHYSHFSSF